MVVGAGGWVAGGVEGWEWGGGGGRCSFFE